MNVEPAILVATVLERARRAGRLVGAGGIVMRGGQVLDCAVSGARRQGVVSPLAAEHRWHLGSIGKSMTAVVAARLVERGELSFDLRPADTDLGWLGPVHPGWRDATLLHFLNNSSGASASFPWRLLKASHTEARARRLRLWAALEILRRPPRFPPGERFAYSNTGFLVAGAMLELACRRPWECLMRELLFEPLGLRSAGFGAPGRTSAADTEPWGHHSLLGLKRAIRPDAPQADNPALLGPAGGVHLSLKDLARYGHEHLLGLRGQSTLLRPETWRRLHAPAPLRRAEKVPYACGWYVDQQQFAAGTQSVLWHDGSNARWYALLALIPDLDAVVALVSNDGNYARAEPAFTAAARELGQRIQDVPLATAPS